MKLGKRLRWLRQQTPVFIARGSSTLLLPRLVMIMPAMITAIAATCVQRKLSSPISTVAIVATTGSRYW